MKEPRFTKRLGFTLIELQVVIVVIGLLAAMAIPAFSQVRKQTRLLESSSLASSIFHDIQTFYEFTGRLPRNNQECGLPEPELIQGKHVASIEVRDGVIFVEYKDRVKKELGSTQFLPILNPDNPTGPLRWERE